MKSLRKGLVLLLSALVQLLPGAGASAQISRAVHDYFLFHPAGPPAAAR
jgi:hypothetical protein